MGSFDTYCPLCGLAIHFINFIINKKMVDFYKKEMNIECKENNDGTYDCKVGWSQKCTVLFQDHTKHDVEFFDGYINNTDLISATGVEDSKIGILVHTECYNLVKKNMNHNLIYDDFNLKKGLSLPDYFGNNLMTYLNYQEVVKYQHQFFDISSLILNLKDLYLITSPNENNKKAKKNAERILKNAKKLLKNKPICHGI